MEPDSKTGVFFNLDECKRLFHILKNEETGLSNDELLLLHRIEKFLYSNLSIKEIDDL